MRSNWFSVVILVGSSGWALAQAPQASPPSAYAAQKLEEVLAGWEKAMAAVTSLHAECNRVTQDKTLGGTEVFNGWAKFVKSGVPSQSSRASLFMEKKGRKDVFERLIFTGNFLYEFAPQHKVIRVHELPPPKNGQIAEDNILAFLFGMKAAEAKRRYHLTYQPMPQYDKWYHHILIQPKETADKAEFSLARLVLSNTTFLPRQMWYVQPNGNTVTWDFMKVVNGAQIPLAEFGQPALPPGWRFERVAREPGPRIIRPNQ